MLGMSGDSKLFSQKKKAEMRSKFWADDKMGGINKIQGVWKDW